MTEQLEQLATQSPQVHEPSLPEQWRLFSKARKIVYGSVLAASFAGIGAIFADVSGALCGGIYGLLCVLGTDYNSRIGKQEVKRKPLIFAPPFPPILFTGEKNKTFRVTGGKNYNVGDNLSLQYPDGVEFAQAVLIQKYTKLFHELDEEDWKGHERFSSPEEMFNQYSRWEGFPVNDHNPLDILIYTDFRLTGPVRSNHAQSSPKLDEPTPGLPARASAPQSKIPDFPGNLLKS